MTIQFWNIFPRVKLVFKDYLKNDLRVTKYKYKTFLYEFYKNVTTYQNFVLGVLNVGFYFIGGYFSGIK